MRLLDIENNQIADSYVPENLEVFSNKFNFNINVNSQTIKGVKVLNPPSVKSYSQFKKFGELAFGDPCQLKPSKRIIKICPTEEGAYLGQDHTSVTGDKQIVNAGISENEMLLEQQTQKLLWETKGLFASSSAESVLVNATALSKTTDQLPYCPLSSVASGLQLNSQILNPQNQHHLNACLKQQSLTNER